MRITKDLLHKFAQETVKQRKRDEPDLYAAYLTGSLLRDEPLLGGTTDIDLVLVHKYKIPVPRETEKLTQELSLDLCHTVKSDYDEYRKLRLDSKMGYPLTHYNILLFDTDHWLEFIQATVNAEFHNVNNVLARANSFITKARENWFSLAQSPSEDHHKWLDSYLNILSLASNAVIGLIAPPLTTRRFLLDLETLTQDLGAAKIYYGFKGLLGLSENTEFNFQGWIDAFTQHLEELQKGESYPVHLAPCRRDYYVKAIQALAESGNAEHAIWPLLRTWLDIHMASQTPLTNDDSWNNYLASLNLTEANSPEKTEALDAFLDNAEIIIETWSQTYGA
jgi:hypothetical protein